jgi:hypothetical protein
VADLQKRRAASASTAKVMRRDYRQRPSGGQPPPPSFSSFRNHVTGFVDSSADSIQERTWPKPPSNNTDMGMWLNQLRGNLYHIVMGGLNQEMPAYNDHVRSKCSGNIMCEITCSSQTIGFLYGE